MNLDVSADSQEVAQKVATWLLAEALATDQVFTICLSGGSTPQKLYRTLTQSPYREHFPWARVHWFWGDERFVPSTDESSNYRMVDTAICSEGLIPTANIHPILTDTNTPELAALAYEQELQAFHGDKTTPLFDITLLGIGSDGHTASLFPGAAALQETSRWVRVVPQPGLKPFVPRITLTFVALNNSRHIAFLVTGSEKQAVLQDLLSGKSKVPASRIKPVGALYWFVDCAAYP